MPSKRNSRRKKKHRNSLAENGGLLVQAISVREQFDAQVEKGLGQFLGVLIGVKAAKAALHPTAPPPKPMINVTPRNPGNI